MIEYESKEELHFSWWLDELKLNDYILKWKYHPKPFSLSDKVKFQWNKPLKTKIKTVEIVILQEHNYQADFLIIWTGKAEGIFFADDISKNPKIYPFYAEFIPENEYFRSVVDVKGTFNQNDAWRRFSIDQKWVWQRYHIMVQKIIPIDLFKKTFTPIRFLKTDKDKKLRRLKYKPISLFEFINEKQN